LSENDEIWLLFSPLNSSNGHGAFGFKTWINMTEIEVIEEPEVPIVAGIDQI
jgi:hypothetical protein